LSRESAHRWRKVASPTHRPHSHPQKHYLSVSCTHFCQMLSELQGVSSVKWRRTCGVGTCHVCVAVRTHRAATPASQVAGVQNPSVCVCLSCKVCGPPHRSGQMENHYIRALGLHNHASILPSLLLLHDTFGGNGTEHGNVE
jgi:hypothetical protein